ncbi:hypothetical protein DPX16_5950 [Anabarilius grahami]|uniref:Uncharacterized protein n=1 Tax=Anabarilius grahami TaxID=495550 RepID=A0A3N0Y349_ANAGA|nr:hypothetical protein DPX16_5950 [Anabarilius grahami]
MRSRGPASHTFLGKPKLPDVLATSPVSEGVTHRCDHGMVTETEEDTPSAMLRMSVSLRKGATFRPGVHVRDGKSRRNPCTGGLKERSNTGVSDETWCSGSLDAQKAAEAGAMSAGCSCNAVYCTAALTLTSRREQRARNTDHSQHPFPTPTCSTAQSEGCAWLYRLCSWISCSDETQQCVQKLAAQSVIFSHSFTIK